MRHGATDDEGGERHAGKDLDIDVRLEASAPLADDRPTTAAITDSTIDRRRSSLSQYDFDWRSKKQALWRTHSGHPSRVSDLASVPSEAPPALSDSIGISSDAEHATLWATRLKVWAIRLAVPPVVIAYVIARPIFEVAVTVKRWEAPCSNQLRVALLVCAGLSLLLMLLVIAVELVLLSCWTDKTVDREMTIRSEIRTKAKAWTKAVGCFILVALSLFVVSYVWLVVSFFARGDCDGLISAAAAFEVYSLPAMVGGVFAALLLRQCAENRVWLRVCRFGCCGDGGAGPARRRPARWSEGVTTQLESMAWSAQYRGISTTLDAADDVVEV